MKEETKSLFVQGMKDGIPIALGYFGVSFTFGIMGSVGGLSWWQTVLISMTCLTSAGQFAGMNIMLAFGGLFEMALAQLVINLRYGLMSISLSQKTAPEFKGLWRWLLGFGMTDEIFAVAYSYKGEVRRSYFFGLMTLPYFGWTFGTLTGAICGNILPELLVNALSVALYGMFVAIVVPEVKGNLKIALPVAVAIGLSCLFAYVPLLSKVSVGFSIIICGVLASAIGALVFPVTDGEEEMA